LEQLKDKIADLCIFILRKLNYAVMLNLSVDDDKITAMAEKKLITVDCCFSGYATLYKINGEACHVRCD
jgi:hypothetical protein